MVQRDYIAFTKSYRNSFFIGLIKPMVPGERLIAEGYLTDGPTWSPNGRTLAFFKTIENIIQYETKLFTTDIMKFRKRANNTLSSLRSRLGSLQLSINFFNILV